jgi:predicted nuclease of restriction endonuclease-like (RecB) superfamily
MGFKATKEQVPHLQDDRTPNDFMQEPLIIYHLGMLSEAMERDIETHFI